MGVNIELLDDAAFPVGYAETVAEVLSVDESNFTAVKDTLYALRRLTEGEFHDVIASMNPDE